MLRSKLQEALPSVAGELGTPDPSESAPAGVAGATIALSASTQRQMGIDALPPGLPHDPV